MAQIALDNAEVNSCQMWGFFIFYLFSFLFCFIFFCYILLTQTCRENIFSVLQHVVDSMTHEIMWTYMFDDEDNWIDDKLLFIIYLHVDHLFLPMFLEYKLS